VLKMESGDGPSLARDHSSQCLVQLVTRKWVTSEMMFEVGALFVEATEPPVLEIAKPSVIEIPGVVHLSTTRRRVSVP